jgi:hypothetical protein
MARRSKPKERRSKRSHRRNSRLTCLRVSDDRCGDAVGFSLSERRRCKGRRRAERAGVKPRIARSISNVHPAHVRAVALSDVHLALGRLKFPAWGVAFISSAPDGQVGSRVHCIRVEKRRPRASGRYRAIIVGGCFAVFAFSTRLCSRRADIQARRCRSWMTLSTHSPLGCFVATIRRFHALIVAIETKRAASCASL